MALHNLLSKADKAVVAYLISVGAGTEEDTVPAKRSQVKDSLPLTIVFSHTGSPPDGMCYSGNITVEMFIEVRTNGVVEENDSEDDPKDNSDARLAAIVDALQVGNGQDGSELAQLITDAARLSDFSITNVEIKAINQGFNPRTIIPATGQMGNAWVDTIHLELECCALERAN